MAETVLVTGGTGFVASWCIVELLKRGFVVRTTVRSLSKEQAVRATISAVIDPGDRLTLFATGLTSDVGWDAAVAGCDYVLHVASPLGKDNPKDPDALIVPARDGALRVLRFATQAAVSHASILRFVQSHRTWDENIATRRKRRNASWGGNSVRLPRLLLTAPRASSPGRCFECLSTLSVLSARRSASSWHIYSDQRAAFMTLNKRKPGNQGLEVSAVK